MLDAYNSWNINAMVATHLKVTWMKVSVVSSSGFIRIEKVKHPVDAIVYNGSKTMRSSFRVNIPYMQNISWIKIAAKIAKSKSRRENWYARIQFHFHKNDVSKLAPNGTSAWRHFNMALPMKLHGFLAFGMILPVYLCKIDLDYTFLVWILLKNDAKRMSRCIYDRESEYSFESVGMHTAPTPLPLSALSKFVTS